MNIENGQTHEPTFTIEKVSDPIAVARARECFERGRQNDDWLQAHWQELLPQALGKFVAVAGQEAHIAGTAEEAWEWAATAHPDDDSVTIQYIHPEQGSRIYDHRR